MRTIILIMFTVMIAGTCKAQSFDFTCINASNLTFEIIDDPNQYNSDILTIKTSGVPEGIVLMGVWYKSDPASVFTYVEVTYNSDENRYEFKDTLAHNGLYNLVWGYKIVK